jgi:hypothetical protein
MKGDMKILGIAMQNKQTKFLPLKQRSSLQGEGNGSRTLLIELAEENVELSRAVLSHFLSQSSPLHIFGPTADIVLDLSSTTVFRSLILPLPIFYEVLAPGIRACSRGANSCKRLAKWGSFVHELVHL